MGFFTRAAKAQRLCFMLAIVLMLVFNSGCGSTTESRDHKEEITLRIGQTQKMVLQHIPDGLTESDYDWRPGTDAIEVDSTGVVTAVKQGMSRVRAFATLKNVVYEEYFYIVVPFEQGEIRGLSLSRTDGSSSDFAEIPLAVGMTILLEATLDADVPEFNPDEFVSWEISDPDIVEFATRNYDSNISGHGRNDEIREIVALSAGEADIQARFKDVVSNTVRIRIYESRESFEYIHAIAPHNPPEIDGDSVALKGRPEERLPFHLTGISGGSTTSGNVSTSGYIMNLRPGSEELFDGFASDPQGKYAIIITPDFNNEEIEGTINENSNVDYEAMKMLPAELLPVSASEIEFILSIDMRAQEKYTYDTGTKAMQIYAVASVKDAKTGKVIRTLSTKNGDPPPNYGYYDIDSEAPERAYGSFDWRTKINMVYELIADVWENEHGLSAEFTSRV